MTREAVAVDVSQDWGVACGVLERFMQAVGRGAETLDYSARCRQVRALGGDGYSLIPLGEDRVALTIGDASGKGLAAALMISNVQSSLRTAALFTGNDPVAVLRAVNRQVYASSLEDRYATLFYGVFDRPTCQLRYVNAGHNPPLVIRRDGSSVSLRSGGAPVGMFPDWEYVEDAVQLNPGDLVLAYTDGVTEAANSAGEEWGVEGLRRTTVECDERPTDEIAEAIFEAMDEFSRGRQTDDATVVLLRVS